MRFRSLLAFAVASLVVFAGCGAVVDGPSSRGTTETLTPVPVTTGTTTPTPPGVHPPGIYPNGSVDVEDLLAAHEAAEPDEAFTWRFRYTIAGRNDDVKATITRRVAVGRDRFLVEQTNSELARNQSLYVTDEASLRTTAGSETTVEAVPVPDDPGSYVFTRDLIERFLTGVTVDVSVVRRGGQPYYRLYTSGDDIPSQVIQSAPDARGYTVTAYVTSDGFVRTVSVNYRRNGSGGQEIVRTRYDYSAVGSTAVTEPDWVSETTSSRTPTREPPMTQTPVTNGTVSPDGTSERTVATDTATATTSPS